MKFVLFVGFLVTATEYFTLDKNATILELGEKTTIFRDTLKWIRIDWYFNGCSDYIKSYIVFCL